MEQKKVLALHDLSAVGRAGLTQVMTALSAMGHQCVPLPTAVYSSHAGIPGFQTQDLTGWMEQALAQYEQLGLTFDGVLSGFLNTPEQISCVHAATARKKPDGIFVVDPVMGDSGTLYQMVTPALTAQIQDLCRLADYITPNITEAAVLLDKPADTVPQDLDEAADWVRALCARYQTHTILTGFGDGDRIYTLCGQAHTVECVDNARIGAYYPGTGDLFAAVLMGGLVRGEWMVQAAQRAAQFVCDCIRATVAQKTAPQWGVQLETELGRLGDCMNQLYDIVMYYKQQGAPSDQAALLSCLREAQQICGGMLDLAAQQQIADGLGVKPSYLQAVAKRISDLKLNGATHTLSVCRGPNCSRKGEQIIQYLEEELGAQPGKCFLNGRWMYQIMGCQRACRTAPNIRIDGKLIEGVTLDMLKRLLEQPD